MSTLEKWGRGGRTTPADLHGSLEFSAPVSSPASARAESFQFCERHVTVIANAHAFELAFTDELMNALPRNAEGCGGDVAGHKSPVLRGAVEPLAKFIFRAGRLGQVTGGLVFQVGLHCR